MWYNIVTTKNHRPKGKTKMTSEKLLDKLIDGAIKAYKEIEGKDKWNSLTENQTAEAIHFVVMDFAKSVLKTLDK